MLLQIDTVAAIQEELATIATIVSSINEVVPKLQLIGLADSFDEVLMNSTLNTDGLITNLATKYIVTGRVKEQRFAQVLAKSVIEKALAPGKDDNREADSGLAWQRAGVRSVFPLINYRDCVEYADGVLKFDGEKLKGRFAVWASGRAADNFIKFADAVTTLRGAVLRAYPSGVRPFMMGGFVSPSLELLDNAYTIEMFED